jgi:cysteine-rich repeat protein
VNKECDDGNDEDNDGCSSSCAVEKDCLCSGGSDISKDICWRRIMKSGVTYIDENPLSFDLEIPDRDLCSNAKLIKSLEIEIQSSVAINKEDVSYEISSCENTTFGARIRVQLNPRVSIPERSSVTLKFNVSSGNIHEESVDLPAYYHTDPSV